jgi:hypothetical protein
MGVKYQHSSDEFTKLGYKAKAIRVVLCCPGIKKEFCPSANSAPISAQSQGEMLLDRVTGFSGTARFLP